MYVEAYALMCVLEMLKNAEKLYQANQTKKALHINNIKCMLGPILR